MRWRSDVKEEYIEKSGGSDLAACALRLHEAGE